MRKGLIALGIISALTLQAPEPAQAAAPFATEVTQLLNHAQLILQYLRQAAAIGPGDSTDGGHEQE